MRKEEEAEWGAGVVAKDGLPLRWRGSAGVGNHLAAGPPEGVAGA